MLYNAWGDGKRQERLQYWNYLRRNRRGNCGIKRDKTSKIVILLIGTIHNFVAFLVLGSSP